MALKHTDKVRRMLREHRIRDAYESIVTEGNPDDETLLLFQRVLGLNWNLFKLQDFSSQMQQYAQEGDPWFQYAWARYQDAVRPDENSVDIAIDNYNKAAEAGIADASMCIAYLWNEGEFGLVDRKRYEEEMEKAIANGSEMAALQKLRDMIGGFNGRDRDPQWAYQTATSFIENYVGEVNPRFYSVVGAACEELGRSMEAYTWYKQGFENGDPKACMKMALLSGGLDDDGYAIRTDDFMEIVDKGLDKDIPDCELYPAYTIRDCDMEALSKKDRKHYLNEITDHFSAAFGLGESLGAYALGDLYQNGRYGSSPDIDKAWEWYMMGALLNSCMCYQCLADMIAQGNAPAEYDEEYMYRFYLESLRYGNDDALINVVKGYRQGHLQDYEEEIEKYYVPLYEEKYEFDDPDQEEMLSQICP